MNHETLPLATSEVGHKKGSFTIFIYVQTFLILDEDETSASERTMT